MKREKKRSAWLIVLILLLVLGAGIWYFLSQRSGEPVAVFPFSYVGMTEYWGDSQESYGPVKTDKIQTVFLSDTQTVTEILVSPGDTVKKGDVLMTFDTTLSDLSLERKRLEVEKLKLQLDTAKNQLSEINAMKPMVIPEPTEPEDPGSENPGIPLTEPYRISDQHAFDGSTQETAMICWIQEETALDTDLLDALLATARTYQAENAAASEPEPLPTDGTQPDDFPESEPTDPPLPTECNTFHAIFKVTQDNLSLGQTLTWQGMTVFWDETTGTYRMQFFDASDLDDFTMAKEDSSQNTPEIDFGSGYTAAQIAQMRSEQEQAIRDLQFQIKMTEADYKIMQTEADNGTVLSEIDGTVVSLLTPEEARQTSQPLLKVSGGGGFYIEAGIGELDREELQLGQEVTVNDWSTGMVYTGTVSSIGDYPKNMDYFSGSGNPNVSYYPFTVFVDESADLQAGNYVNISYSTGSGENGIYLENPFLRTEQGRSYVFVQDSNGLLEKRYVTTGKSLWGSYTEILDGLTEEDLIAFPYGKQVKSGAPAVERDLSSLYG